MAVQVLASRVEFFRMDLRMVVRESDDQVCRRSRVSGLHLFKWELHHEFPRTYIKFSHGVVPWLFRSFHGRSLWSFWPGLWNENSSGMSARSSYSGVRVPCRIISIFCGTHVWWILHFVMEMWTLILHIFNWKALKVDALLLWDRNSINWDSISDWKSLQGVFTVNLLRLQTTSFASRHEQGQGRIKSQSSNLSPEHNR